jgi:hypothetical protein
MVSAAIFIVGIPIVMSLVAINGTLHFILEHNRAWYPVSPTGEPLRTEEDA